MESSDREGEKPPEGGGGGGCGGGGSGGGGATGEPKGKRKMKTAKQLEALERTYQVEAYPSEAIRAELSVQLDLNDRQLQMWFCHRRLKDRKTTTNNNSNPSSSSSKKARKSEASPATITPPAAPPSTSAAMETEDFGNGGELGNEYGSGSGSGSSPYAERRHLVVPRTGVAVPRISRPRYYELPPQSIAETRAISFIEAQLGEPFREDGPALGMEFDPLPPGAFGASIVPSGVPQKQAGRVYESNLYERHDVNATKGHGRAALHEYQFLPEQPHYYGSPSDGRGSRTPVRSYLHDGEELPSYSVNPYNSIAMESPFNSHPTDTGLMPHEDDAVRLERKRKTDESRNQKEVEVHEKRIRKELEKQDLLRRKREEQMRKEMEKHDRERKKEEERMLRERLREEERFQREQKREMERREKFMLRESLRAEKLKQKEDLRREREAVRQKAANDRAVARKLAKESTELIEDERLELMEIATSRKGLQSIISLDSETLQNLDAFRDMLCEFPPKTLQLKRPFSIQPWMDSEENIGNLLMLWRFFITFADVFGLWPFTLDEFVQAFHDYDPRLLGEIHIALLRSIIKDIEDVARTPFGPGANQNNAANPGAGHPQIVEGAYAWGFDIQSWQQHLSPLTWPEILRQFALSAGFGPKLKKNTEPSHFRDDIEGNDGTSVVSNLRNGAAVEKAVAIMQEKGYGNPRRSRHRLTPGTVKFAAFHVLSIEGDAGLNIIEVSDRIQKSGLRDLSTSKTPEASIAAALSRDTKLFERVAPSTYCVRPPFRKDPADSVAILADALEKIRAFKNGFVDEVEVEDAEKDDDSESDLVEDPEVEDPRAELITIKEVEPSHEANRLESDKANGLPSVCPDRVAHNEVVGTAQDDNDIDEGSSSEPWVQGLIEGDYSDLSVEERLNALVALFSVAIEGNSIRAVLEERLEAANALKKQMWAEAQLDKRRIKEENTTRPQCVGQLDAELDHKPNAEMALEKISTMNVDSLAGQDNMCASSERSRAQLKSYIGHKAEDLYVYKSLPLGMDRRRNRYWQFIASASCNDPGSGRIFVELHNGCWKLMETEEAFDTLLQSLDIRGLRESHLHAMLQRVESLFKESVKRKLLTTNAGKAKADAMKTEGSVMLSNPESSEDSPNSTISASNPDVPEMSSSFHIECGRNNHEVKNILKRYKDSEEWMWKECLMSSVLHANKYGRKRCTQLLGLCDCCHDLYFFEDSHCPTCHNTFSDDMDTNFPDHVSRCEEMLKFNPSQKMKGLDSLGPVRIRLLKAQLACLEVSIPAEVFRSSWSDEYRRSWCMQFLASSSADYLLLAVTALEAAIKKDFLSPSFQTTYDLLTSSNKSKHDSALAFNLRDVSVLPWIPQTTAAVALRLRELDSAISYTQQQKEEFKKEAEARLFVNIQSKFNMARNVQGNEVGALNGNHVQEETWLDPSGGVGVGGGSSKGRGRGGSRSRSARGGGGRSRLNASKRNGASTSGRARGGKKRRTAKSKPKSVKKPGPSPVPRTVPGYSNQSVAPVFDTSPALPMREEDEEEEWNVEEAVQTMQVEETGDGNDSNSEYEYDDNMVEEDDGYVGGYGASKVSASMMMEGGSDEDDIDADVDVRGEFESVGYSEQEDDVEGYLNAESEDEGNQNLEQDEVSSSSEYSE